MMMKRIKHIVSILCCVALFACDNNEAIDEQPVQQEPVNFSALCDYSLTKAEPTPLSQENIVVIAPGYGAGAANQVIYYNAVIGEMTPVGGAENPIKWSARNMVFTAWMAPTGVVLSDAAVSVPGKAAEGTVDFSADLEALIGAYVERDYDRSSVSVPVEFLFSHLVTKFTITLENIADGVQPIGNTASIVFPAIKKIGAIKVDLTGMPQVSPGRSGSELSLPFAEEDNKAMLTCYMPPMTASQLLMYGSFTVKVGGTTYVGTLNNLGAGEIKAGEHYTFTIQINDDHTALLQAVTLAPWDKYDRNIYNRPYAGIWGMEDMQDLAELINKGAVKGDGKTGTNGLTMDDLCDADGVIRMYTNVTFGAKDQFEAIGTASNPFKDYLFDGNGYAVSGISIQQESENNQGLFGVIQNATIKNLTLKGLHIEGKNNAGMLVGQANGSSLIDHCFVSGGEVSGVNSVGGLIGKVGSDVVIHNCGVSPRLVSGSKEVGGFVGTNDGVVGNCYSVVSSITCVYSESGGFVGKNSGVTRNSYSVATFGNGSTNCGAWVGANVEGTVSACYWNTECIDNSSCFKVIGNNTELENEIEKIPSGTGTTFDKATGRIVHQDDTYEPLYDRLNNYIDNYPDVSTNYLRWAVIAGGASKLPVYSY